jgi:transposase-like protein
LGYKTFYCNNCKRGFNERTGSPFNRRQVPTDIIFEVVLWRLRFKLSLGDLCEMYSVKGFYFTRETVRHWEEQYAPLITDELKVERKGKTSLRWKVDETLLKVKKKFYYLYRAIDSQGHLVDTKLSEVRDSKSTTAFFEQAVETTGQIPEQITSDKEVTYPGAIEKGLGRKVEHRTDRYRNNRLEQDHRGIKGRYKSMKGFKNPVSAERFCQDFDEQRNYFHFRRWHKDRWKAGWQRADFKSKFYRLKNKFINRKLVWIQSILPLQI